MYISFAQVDCVIKSQWALLSQCWRRSVHQRNSCNEYESFFHINPEIESMHTSSIVRIETMPFIYVVLMKLHCNPEACQP